MFDEFVYYVRQLAPSKLFVILHHNADPDAIAAAEAVGRLITQLNPAISYVIFSDEINTSATRLMQELNIEVHSHLPQLNEKENNLVLTVDTANLSQLGKYANFVVDQDLPLMVIDHHDTSEIANNALASIVDISASSTCVIVYKLYEAAGIVPDPDVATMLMSGHIYDSARFRIGSTAEVFDIFVKLINAGGNYALANELLQNEMSYGEKIARFKAYQRLKYHQLPNQIIVVTSTIGAFESSVARSMIGTGADISLVLAVKDDELRGSARCQIDLNIGDIISRLSEEFGGTGGGHAQAAGMNISPVPTKNVRKEIIKRFIELIKLELLKD